MTESFHEWERRVRSEQTDISLGCCPLCRKPVIKHDGMVACRQCLWATQEKHWHEQIGYVRIDKGDLE